MSFVLSWLFRDGRAGLWLVAFVVLATSGRASAGCGDYLVIENADPAHPHHPDKPPCQGPHCSANPAAPAPLTPPTPTTSPVSHDALLPISSPNDATASVRLTGWTRSVPVGHPADIFHPPRLG